VVRIALRKTAKRAEILRAQGVQRTVGFSDPQAAVRRAVHLEIGPGQQLARSINNQAQALCEHNIKTVIRWIPRHLAIPRKEEAERSATGARKSRGITVQEQVFISATK